MINNKEFIRYPELDHPLAEEKRKLKMEYLDLVAYFANSNLQELANYWISARKVEDVADLQEMVTPKTLLFKQDGTMLLLLECVWDIENGVAVRLSPEIAVGSQNIFL